MSLISRLRDAIRRIVDPDEASPDRDERMTVATLLVLVARVDGRILPVEQAGLRAVLRSRFSISDESAARVLAAVDEVAHDVDEASALADRILHDTAPETRPQLLAMAYRVAAVDGFVHEFEDNLIWRIGHLLGLDDARIGEIREEALRNLAPERAARA